MWRMVTVALDWASARSYATAIAASTQDSTAETKRLRTAPFYGRLFALTAGPAGVRTRRSPQDEAAGAARTRFPFRRTGSAGGTDRSTARSAASEHPGTAENRWRASSGYQRRSTVG